MGLEAEAVLQGKTLKKLASDLILKNISEKAFRFVQESRRRSPPGEEAEIQMQSSAPKRHRLRISEDRAAIQKIRDLWALNPRPSQREIARKINYPASSAKYQIKIMLENGELKK